MLLRSSAIVIAVSLVTACASAPKMSHPEVGTVSTTDERFVKEQDGCLEEYLRAQMDTEEAKDQEKRNKFVGLVSRDLEALMEISDAVRSSPEAMKYTDTCLQQRGWKKVQP